MKWSFGRAPSPRNSSPSGGPRMESIWATALSLSSATTCSNSPTPSSSGGTHLDGRGRRPRGCLARNVPRLRVQGARPAAHRARLLRPRGGRGVAGEPAWPGRAHRSSTRPARAGVSVKVKIENDYADGHRSTRVVELLDEPASAHP